MPRIRLRHAFVAVMLMLAMLSQGTWALAGTTGNLSGTLADSTTGKGIANAKITAVSPSQSAGATTDASGHFTILNLAPDTYTVSAEKDGFAPQSIAGVTVFADQTQTVAITTTPQLKQIANVTSRAAGALVKAGTTADVYSINSSTANAASALGGGGALNQAYSAVASVPGTYVPSGAVGWNQTVLIRGGDYDQVGFEYDGVPVNRSFDNYPAHTASSLGQQEVEIYTGSSPANAESTGLAGFINQVIKTGTYPGFSDANLSIGGPSFYHKANIEVGGATPNRNFSYYLGIGGYNQAVRYIDNSNGTSWAKYAPAFFQIMCDAPGDANNDACYVNNPDINGTAGGWDYFATPDGGPVGPGNAYIQGPFNVFNAATLTDRDTVLNLHFGLPHHHDSGRDDIQLLYSTSMLNTSIYDSASDWGFTLNPAAQNSIINYGGSPFGPNGEFPALPSPSSYHYTGKLGAPIAPGSVAGSLQGYTFPENPPGPFIPFTQRGGYWNDDSIIKLQFTKNFSSDAYLRLYGYTFYSDWLNNDPNTISPNNGVCCVGQGLIQEYELFSHTRGLSAQFADQLNSTNLLNIQASSVVSSVVRYNNSGSYLDSGKAAVVSSANPDNGVCYDINKGTGTWTTTGTSGGCYSTGFKPANLNPGVTLADVSSVSCGGAPCEWLAVESGEHGTFNTVKPTFNAYSIIDQYQPFDKLLLNVGLRYETFGFQGPDTTTINGARPFWFAAYNNAYCASTTPGTGTIKGTFAPGATTATCPAGTAVLNTNPALAITGGPLNNFYHELEPRISGTYTVNPTNVLRFSYGRYAQPGDTAAEQYNAKQGDLPGGLLGPIFYPYGYHSSTHDIPPEVSNNYDFSWEHQFKGTDMSMKITPFWRSTQGEQTAFFIDPLQAFVSNIPVGNLNSRGVEFAFTKGDFSRNGFAAQLAFTYTYTDIKYTTLPNGGTPLSQINNDIATFNAYTSACAAAPTNPACLTQGGTTPTDPNYGAPIVASPCYGPAGGGAPGAPVACGTPGAIANPYWNAPLQSLFNLNGPYWPTDTVVATTGLGSNSYAVPYVGTLLLNYKHDRFTITPSLQFEGGQRYGEPENTEGVQPNGCTAGLAGSLAGDPRYMGGTAGLGGAPYDATTCGALIAIPNIYNHNQFDQIAQYVAPSQLLANLQLSYDISPKITATLTMTNIANYCFGGTKTAWTTALGNGKTCSYTGTASAFVQNPVGNFYNPGTSINPVYQYPYQPYPGTYNPDGQTPNQPFNAYLNFNIKL